MCGMIARSVAAWANSACTTECKMNLRDITRAELTLAERSEFSMASVNKDITPNCQFTSFTKLTILEKGRNYSGPHSKRSRVRKGRGRGVATVAPRGAYAPDCVADLMSQATVSRISFAHAVCRATEMR